MPDMKLFTGNATPELAQKIADRLFIKLGNAAVGRFSDGEISVQINENVRGGDIFIIQSTCAPTNDNLMEIMLMVDALKRASARSGFFCNAFFNWITAALLSFLAR